MATAYRMQFVVAAVIVAALLVPAIGFSQVKTAAGPANKPAAEWDEIDERLVFLVESLANVEASLDAVNSAIQNGSAKRPGGAGDAKRAAEGGGRSAREAKAAVKWPEFYSKVAEKFFHHPVGQSKGYHTQAVLARRPDGEGEEANGAGASPEGAGAKAAIPRFEHFARVYQDAKGPAESALTNMPLEELQRRRIALEEEQDKLWCAIAFQVVASSDLANKPLYRFEPYIATTGTTAVQRGGATRAVVLFIQSSLGSTLQADRDQEKALAGIKSAISDARAQLDASWLRLPILAEEAKDQNTPIGKIAALIKRMDNVASNLTDSYKNATDRDPLFEPRRAQFRALLQDSAIRYAEIVIALDETFAALAGDWQLKLDMNSPMMLPTASDAPQRPVAAGNRAAMAAPVIAGDWRVFAGRDLQDAFELRARASNSEGGIELTQGQLGETRSSALSKSEFKFPMEVEFTVVSLADSGIDLCPGIGDIQLEWGVNWNKSTYLQGKKVRYEATHVSIVPGQENVIKMAVDRDGHVVVTINDQQTFDEKMNFELPPEAKIMLGGGIGHVEYRKVRIRTGAAK